MDKKRVDELGRAFAGSQLQLQLYVSRRQAELRHAVQSADPSIVDLVIRSPLEADRFRECKDAEFLAAVDLSDHRQTLTEFWPNRGPVWDAVGTFGGRTSPSVVLFEAKSYPAEVKGSGRQATAPASIRLIDAALDKAKTWLGVDPVHDWTGRLYQYANRLAHLYFLREVLSIDARLVNIFFLDDATTTPTTRQDWADALVAVKRELGLPDRVEHVIDIFLPARSRDELVTGSAR